MRASNSKLLRLIAVLGLSLMTGIAVGAVVGAVRAGSVQPQTITVLVAALSFSLTAAVGYIDRILEHHRVEIVPIAVMPKQLLSPTPENPHPIADVELRVLLINGGNRHSAVTKVLVTNFMGPYAHGGTGMMPKDAVQDPVVLAPGEMRSHVYHFQYWPTRVYEAADVGEMVGPSEKRVLWNMTATVLDSSGASVGDWFQQFPLWHETVGPLGHSSGGHGEARFVVRDRWRWLGALGRWKH